MPATTHVALGIGAWGILILTPGVVVNTLTGMIGRRPGKRLLSLKVRDHLSSPLGIAHGIIREIAKPLSPGFFVGTFWALQRIIARGQIFCDDLNRYRRRGPQSGRPRADP